MVWFSCRLEFIRSPASRALDAFLESGAGEVLAWVWNLASGGIASIILLSSMVEDLSREIIYLTNGKIEVLHEVERGMLENKRITPSMQTWREEVDKVLDGVRELHSSFMSIEGFSLQSRYQLGSAAHKLLEEVRRLQTQRTTLVIMEEAMPDPVDPQVIPPHTFLGMEDNLSKLRHMLDDDDSQIIGIYGMGGVGKTTLLIQTNNQLLMEKSDQFNLVIFVTVSSNVNVNDIQKVIASRLGYSNNEGAQTLCKALMKKKFLLLLDDLWSKLDLGMIGIPLSPLSKKGSKIVFTTRSHKVCIDMGAAENKIEVRPLSESRSWKLFCEKLGNTREEEWNGSTKILAKKVAKKCGGLPLALITVGSAMVGASTDGEWEETLIMLKGTGADLGDMKDVLTLLKFSFDRLKDEHLKQCLLYCALYPEDCPIEVDELIEYWIGEGFLGKVGDSIWRARNRGRAAITALKDACLLEDGNAEITSRTVKIHDFVHKMALWITRGDCEKDETIFLSYPREGLESAPTTDKWTHAMRISLTVNRIRELPQRPYCQNLRTLLLRENKTLEQIPSGFFMFMPHLTVLDLSSTNVTCIPSDIGLLDELRYLDLSDNSRLQSLPKEVWGLKKLRMLNLNWTTLQRIPKEAITLFSSLQSLKLYMTKHKWRGGYKDRETKHIEKEVCLKDLDGLKQLEELDLEFQITSLEDWCGLSNSHKLCSIFTGLLMLNFNDIDSLDLFGDLRTPNQLRRLAIMKCSHLNRLVFPVNQDMKVEELFFFRLPLEKIDWKDDISMMRKASPGSTFKNLHKIEFQELALREITWTSKLPFLEYLYFRDCNEMEEMIKIEELDITMESKRDSFFPSLKTLKLDSMRNLKSICQKSLLFPSLKCLYINECSMLSKLPFKPNSCIKLMSIRGSTTWWNELEWKDEGIKSIFTTYFCEEGEDEDDWKEYFDEDENDWKEYWE